MLRIQKGNSFTTLVPYDFETVTRNKYLQQAQSCGFPSHRNTLAEHKCGGTLLLLLHTTHQFDSFEVSLHSSTNAPSVCLYGNSFASFAVSLQIQHEAVLAQFHAKSSYGGSMRARQVYCLLPHT